VKGIEDLRTPLRTILDIEQQLRGTIAGFMMPSFVVDLPGGGGKRLATAHETYDRSTGISTFRAPGLSGEKGQRIYQYHDPKPAHAVVEATKPAHIEVGEPKRRPRFVPADASFKGFITRQEMSGRAMAMSPRC
jgi:lysine 2,3-aminomutase